MHTTSENVATRPPNFPDRCVMMWKTDGLCQRIVATINGLVIASEFNLQFKLAWIDDKIMKSRFGRDYSLPNDTPLDPRSIFSNSFVEKYLMEDDGIYYPPDLIPRLRTNRLNVTARDKIVMNTKNDFVRAADDNIFFGVAPHLLHDQFVPDHLEKCRSTVGDRIFSDEILRLIDDIDSNVTLGSMWTIHLRAGDVVYGEVRKRFPRRRFLSLTVPIAIDICRIAESSGKKVLVVGATKQEIDFVLSRCPNAVSANDFDLPILSASSAVIRDVILMSRCERLFSAEGSTVVQLANYFGDPILMRVGDFYAASTETDVLKSALERGDLMSCHDLQKVFVYYNLFILNWNKESFEELDSYLNMAFKFDPENIGYVVLRYLNCLSFSKFQRARKFRVKFFRLVEMVETSRGLGKRKMMGHIGFRSQFMEKFLTHIYQNIKLPENDNRRIGAWIDRFYSKNS